MKTLNTFKKSYYWVSLLGMGAIGLLAAFYRLGDIPLMPGLAVAWIYHWSLYRPAATPIILVVVWTGIYDLFVDNPLGFSPFLFYGSYIGLLLVRKRLYTRRFSWVWIGFACYAVCFGFIYWGLGSLLVKAVLNPHALILSLLFACGVYPLLSRLMIAYQRWWSPHG